MEDYTKKYKRKEYQRATEIVTGDKVIHKYSNGDARVQVGDILGSYAQILEGSSFGSSETSYYKTREHLVPLSILLEAKNLEGKEKFEVQEDINEIAHNILWKIKIDNKKFKAKGGDLSEPLVQVELLNKLFQFKNYTKQYSVEERSVPAAGFSGANSATMTSTRSGYACKIETNTIHRGGYYGGSTPLVVQIQSGGALDYKTQTGILSAAKVLLSRYTFTTTYGVGKRIHESSGTNWSAVGLVAPEKYEGGGCKFSIIPAFNNVDYLR